MAKKAIQKAKEFQLHLSALLDADNIKLTETQ
jgi:hypothetical protein